MSEPEALAGGTRVLPMFPLGGVLLPTQLLPLHVFEDRYRRMVRDCLSVDGRFGIVLIARGSEVGGGDERLSVGTLARMEGATELDDGRWVLAAVGERRLRVARWLDDDPYPRAEVELLADPGIPLEAGELAPDDGDLDVDLLRRAERAVRRSLAFLSELGEPATDATVELDADPATRVWQLSALAPLGPFDRQRLLEHGDHPGRLELLATLAHEAGELLEARLAAGG